MGVSRSVGVRAAFLGAGCCLSAWSLFAQQQPSQQELPTIRTGVTMVPVDVRVLDRKGLAVTDLRPEDFSILEDGVAQRIAHFSIQALTPEPTAGADTPALRRGAFGELSPQNRRVFLILLGRGRMTGPSDELRALREFIEARLLPQDQVAVMAYNRATDFTTDHQAVLQLVERFRKRHTTVESMLAHHFRDLQGQYGSSDIPPHIQREIDAIFAADQRLATRALRGAGVARTSGGEGRTDAALVAWSWP